MTKFIQKFDFSSIIEILSDQILQRIEIKHGPQVIETCIRIEELIVFLEQNGTSFKCCNRS